MVVAAGFVGQARRAGHGDRHSRWIGDRRQIHVPNTVAELGRDASRDLDCEPGLASATCTGQRHQPFIGQQLPPVSHLCAGADKAGELHWKVMHTNAFRGSQRREIVAQIRMAELDYPLGTGPIAQQMSSEIGEPGIGQETVDDHVLGRAGQRRLPAVRRSRSRAVRLMVGPM